MTGLATPRRGPARRAVLRWAWRLARRERGGQLVLLALLTATAVVSVGGLTITSQLTRAAAGAGFGTASHTLALSTEDGHDLATDVDAALRHFPLAEVIRRQPVSAPGLFGSVELREVGGVATADAAPGPAETLTDDLHSVVAG